MDEYLTKPIDKQKLLGVLQHYLRASATLTERAAETPLADLPAAAEDEGAKLPTLQAMAVATNFDPEDIAVMLGLLLEGIDERLDAMQKAEEEGDTKTIFMQAHAIKGAASNIALAPVVELTAEMEEAARKGQEIDYSKRLVRLRSYIDAAKKIGG